MTDQAKSPINPNPSQGKAVHNSHRRYNWRRICMTNPPTRPQTKPDNDDATTGRPECRGGTSLAPITVRIMDAANMLGIGRTKIYELITSGDIETLKLGRSTLIPVDSLHALIDRLRREPSNGR
jgi:excisionase family DNA binding protein